MSLVDELMKADARKADERETGVFKSRQLAKILGKDEPVDVQIQEISQRRKNELVSMAYEGEDVNIAKAFDSNLKVIVAGVIDPPLKDKDLQEKFGCKMAIDLAEKLFKDEVNTLSTAIANLGTVGDEVLDEDEIKN